jgi:voltage-gated potassium channel
MIPCDHRFLFLLASVLAMILLTPLLESINDGGITIAVVFLLTLISVVFTATEIMFRRLSILVLAALWLVLRFATPLVNEPIFLSLAQLAYIAVMGVSLFHVVQALVRADRVTVDILAGGAAVYLMFSVIWALSFSLMEGLVPGSVFSAPGNHAEAWNKIYYFSLSTLTTLGYGDLVPASAFARTWAALESALGVLYLAVFMARLIGIFNHGQFR